MKKPWRKKIHEARSARLYEGPQSDVVKGHFQTKSDSLNVRPLEAGMRLSNMTAPIQPKIKLPR